MHDADVTHSQAADLACAQSAAIAQREHHLDLEGVRHGQQALGLSRAHGQGQLLRFPDVIDLGRQIVPAQRDPEQELHPCHDAVTIADAGAGLHQIKLKGTNLIRRRPLRRTLQIGREALAAVNMAALGVLVELARLHVHDHALTQFTDD